MPMLTHITKYAGLAQTEKDKRPCWGCSIAAGFSEREAYGLPLIEREVFLNQRS
jgi:hypothetical protein